MLFDYKVVLQHLQKYSINVRGVLHIGAHECEEKGFYNSTLGIDDDHILWIDGNPTKVKEMVGKVPHVYQAVLDEVERDIEFHITDNSQASSLLKLNHEEGFYKSIHIVKSIPCRTKTLTSFFKELGANPEGYNFWNLDIQGSELAVLRGSKELLAHADAIYTEVNAASVYKDCGLINELDALLASYGLVRIDTKWTDCKWGDALYVRTGLKKVE
jgi:FkbM family methyltransferase